ncbi:MAG: hypothetical protein V4449_04095 [Patescibacteria group bacterium]
MNFFETGGVQANLKDRHEELLSDAPRVQETLRRRAVWLESELESEERKNTWQKFWGALLSLDGPEQKLFLKILREGGGGGRPLQHKGAVKGRKRGPYKKENPDALTSSARQLGRPRQEKTVKEMLPIAILPKTEHAGHPREEVDIGPLRGGIKKTSVSSVSEQDIAKAVQNLRSHTGNPLARRSVRTFSNIFNGAEEIDWGRFFKKMR